ncbi:hypothetical protein Vafri_2230 [Volvox africanus]|nr:hypothetical protein Vafri_2230 [Volvox africanus]
MLKVCTTKLHSTQDGLRSAGRKRLMRLTLVCLFLNVLCHTLDKVQRFHSCPVSFHSQPPRLLRHFVGAQVTAFVAQAWPFVRPLGISGIVGYACGIFVRRVMQMMVLGLAFVISAVQILAYFNWVTVHWDRINSDLAKLLGEGRDVASSNSAGFDASTLLAMAFERLATVFSTGLPSLAGFATGLTLAFMPGMALA